MPVIAQQNDTLAHEHKAQNEKVPGLLLAYNFSKYHFAEIGYAVGHVGIAGHHPVSNAYFGSVEINPGHHAVVGFKTGGWFAANGLNMGVNTIYYTNFSKGTLAFRPEIGIGGYFFKMVYGYNAQLTNTSFNRIGKHVFNITYFLRLKGAHITGRK